MATLDELLSDDSNASDSDGNPTTLGAGATPESLPDWDPRVAFSAPQLQKAASHFSRPAPPIQTLSDDTQLPSDPGPTPSRPGLPSVPSTGVGDVVQASADANMPTNPVAKTILARRIAASVPQGQASGAHAPAPTSSPASPQAYGFGAGLTDSDLADAQDQAREGSRNALIGGAFAQIANSLSRSNQPTNQAPFEAMAQQARQPVADMIARRQAAMQNFQLGQEQQKNDPNSPDSQALQGVVKTQFPGVNAAGISVANMPTALKPIDLKAQIDARKQAEANNLEMRRLMLGNSINNKDLDRQQHALDKLDADKDYVSAQSQVRKAPQLASLADDATTNPESAAALATEAGLYISGGQRLHGQTIAAFQGGSPAIMARLAQIAKTSADGTLTPQNAAFMKSFIQKQAAAAQSVVSGIKADKVTDYKNTFGKAPGWAQSNTPAMPQTPVQAHPQDQQAVQWAKANPNDKRSAQILKLNGITQ